MPYCSRVSRVLSASAWLTLDKAAAPKITRVLWWPVLPKSCLAIIFQLHCFKQFAQLRVVGSHNNLNNPIMSTNVSLFSGPMYRKITEHFQPDLWPSQIKPYYDC